MRDFSPTNYRFGAASGGLARPGGKLRRGKGPSVLQIGYPAEAGSLPHARRKPGHRKARPSRGVELLAAIGVAVLFAVSGTVYHCAGLLAVAEGTFYDNVYIEGVDVGGMTREQVLDLFAGEKGTPNMGLSLTVDGKNRTVTAGDIGAHYDVDETVGNALAIGHGGNVLQRLGDVLELRKAPRSFTFTAQYDDEKVRELAGAIAREINTPPTKAALQFLPEAERVFAYTPEAAGKSLDEQALYAQMKEALSRGGVTPLTVNSALIAPEETVAALKDRTQLLGTYTTALKNDTVRNKNIKLAGTAVNGTMLAPGETFSFNGRTGERTIAKGYVDGPAISNNQIVDAPGGGVCQVSSTIYNAALLSGLEIVERHNHTWPVSYVPPGFDATVAWDSKDLRIRNNTSVNIYLVFRMDEAAGLVSAEFYGLPGKEEISTAAEGFMTVTPETPLKYGNPNKPIGWTRTITAARNGCRLSVYRVFTSGGETHRELVSNDFYPPQRGEIEIGTLSTNDDDK